MTRVYLWLFVAVCVGQVLWTLAQELHFRLVSRRLLRRAAADIVAFPYDS